MRQLIQLSSLLQEVLVSWPYNSCIPSKPLVSCLSSHKRDTKHLLSASYACKFSSAIWCRLCIEISNELIKLNAIKVANKTNKEPGHSA